MGAIQSSCSTMRLWSRICRQTRHRRSTHPIGGLDDDRHRRHAARFSGPDQFVLPAFYVPMATLPRLQAFRLTSSRVATSRTSRSKAASSRASRSRERTLRCGAASAIACERAYPDTNRNQGLAVQTEFDARVRHDRSWR